MEPIIEPIKIGYTYRLNGKGEPTGLLAVPLTKSQMDIFGGTAPEVPKPEANPKADRLNALIPEHKQMYNNLLTKQKKNTLMPAEKTHLQMFNRYLNGENTHEQLKNYIGYKQDEAHMPLFSNAEVPKIEMPKTPPVAKYTPPVNPVEKPATKPVSNVPEPSGSMFSDPDEPKVKKSQINMFGGDEPPEVPMVENKPVKVETKVKSAKNKDLPVVDHSEASNEDVMKNFGQHVPELAGLMQEGIDTHKKLNEIVAKAGGHREMGEYTVDGVKAFDHYPNPARLYSQYIRSNRATQEKRDVALNEFKERLQAAKEYLSNPESDEDLAKVKEQRESKKKSDLEERLKRKAETEAMLDARVPENKARAKTYTDNFDFIKKIVPSSYPISPDRDLRWYGEGSEGEHVGNMLHDGVSKENITLGKKIHERMDEGKEVKVTPFHKFMQGFGGRHSFDVDSLNEDLKTYAATKGDAFHSKKIEDLRNDLSKIAAEHKANFEKSQINMFNEEPKVDDIKVKNPHIDKAKERWAAAIKERNVGGWNVAKEGSYPKDEKLKAQTKRIESKGFGRVAYRTYHNPGRDFARDKPTYQQIFVHPNGKEFIHDTSYAKPHILVEYSKKHDLENAEKFDLNKSQMNMFSEEPKVDDIKVDTPKLPEAKPSKNFIKPEHQLTSDNGTWKVKGDPTATAKMHSWIKDKYKNKEIYTYGGLLASGHPLADKIKELHGNNKTAIFDHFNKLTGRESGKEKGVGENQLRMSMKDSQGAQLGDKHFQVPDLSKQAKVERDSYPNGEALHNALNNQETSNELYKWHKDYKFNDFHKNKATIEYDKEGNAKKDSAKPYQRTLFNPKTEDFGKSKAAQGNNLTPEDLEKYNSLKDKYKDQEFTPEHKTRLEELTKKSKQKFHLSDKFEPDDKKAYDKIDEEKSSILERLQDQKDPLTIVEQKEHNDRYKELSAQQSEMLGNYREKLGLHKGDATGEQGFSYKEPMPEEEQKELENLKGHKEFAKLHGLYNQAPEEHHITKLLKHPMSSNLKTFDQTDSKEEPEEMTKEINFNQASKPTVEPVKNEKVKVKKEKSEPTLNPEQASEKLESHFPTVGIQNPGSLNKTLREYGHTPEESDKEYKPGSLVDFNGSKYSIDKDGGSYVLAKNQATGKSETIHKGDLEHFPTNKKVPAINKQSVQSFMEKQGDASMPLEEVYAKMGFPSDAKGKDYIKKRLKVALLQLEHHHETGGYHEPIVSREVGKSHPDEKDPKEKGIMYKLAKSFMDYAAQTIRYIKSKNLIKSLMIELLQKEKSIYEKSLESKDIFQSLEETREQEGVLINVLDAIQEFTIKKSGIPFAEDLCYLLDETTEYLCKSGQRFDLLKSMDDGSFQKAVDAAIQYEEEQEKQTTYKFINPKYTDNAEDINTAGTEK